MERRVFGGKQRLWEDIDARPTSRENGWKSILKACLRSRHSNTSGSLRCILW